MLTHPTLDQLKALKLDGMADAFVELQAQDSSDELTLEGISVFQVVRAPEQGWPSDNPYRQE
jgi:hypothetical protein